MAELKSKSGKIAILYRAAKGAVIEGDGIAALADDSWFRVVNKAATGSQLPYDVGYQFKSPDSGNAITPIVDDDVIPLTLTKLCKVDLSIGSEKGVLENTDDCTKGYISNIVDGFTAVSGTFNAFMKFNDPGGGQASAQEEILNRFFDIQDDDGAGVYSITLKNDEDLLMFVLNNSDQVAVDDIKVFTIINVILSGLTTDKGLKAVQNFDVAWTKGEGPASQYNRTTNSSESTP